MALTAAEPLAATTATQPERLSDWEVEVFYDGDCPLCRKEIGMLRRWDKRGVIVFTDIAADGFDPGPLGVPFETLMAEIHGRLPNGQIITGVEVFRRLYSAVGLGWLVAPTRLPVVRHLLDAGYRFFARYRLALTGRRCQGDACQVEP